MRRHGPHPNPWVAAHAAGPGVKRPRGSPTFINELLAAQESLTFNEELVMALRSQRARSGLSQRAYAALRGWSSNHVARLETQSVRLRISDVVDARRGSDYTLLLAHAGSANAEARDAPVATRLGCSSVSPDHWDPSDLLAKTIDNKRFPVHIALRRTDGPAWY